MNRIRKPAGEAYKAPIPIRVSFFTLLIAALIGFAILAFEPLSPGSQRIEATNYNAQAREHRLIATVVGKAPSDSTVNRSVGVGTQTHTLSAGRAHTCAVRENGAIECWGHNDDGEADAPSGRFSSVSAGILHTCAVRESGAVDCWGYTGSRTDAPSGRFSAVSAGGWHSCGLRESGKVECWGQSAPSSSDDFRAVSAGSYHSCGLRETGAVECWGVDRGDDNDNGQANAPSGRFRAVSAGWFHSCGLRETRVVECWGNNEAGQADPPSGHFSAVSAGAYHSCGLRETGAIECWGYNRYGQADPPSGHFSAVSAGAGHSCGLRETSTVECWGWNDDGQADAPSGRFRVAGAQADSVEPLPDPIVRGQIVALEREDGRIEIGFQPANGLRILPPRRLFPTGATVGRWYRTGPVEYLGGEIGRVRVRRLVDGRVELAFQPTNGEWLYPTGRYLSANNVGSPHWVKSTTIEMSCLDVCDPDVNNPGVQRYLAEVYAPILRFDRGEEFHPVGVEAMVKNAKMMDATAALAGERFTAEAIWRWNAVGITWADGVDGGPSPWPLPSDVAPENTYLSLNVDIGAPALYHNHGRYVNWWKAIRDQYDPTVYYRVAEIDDRIVLQYWLFYVWNSPSDFGAFRDQNSAKEFSHEGDWENIQLVFDRSVLLRALRTGDAPQPIGVGFAQHEHGTWVLSADVQWYTGTHPTVFVADGSHASYHESGKTRLHGLVVSGLDFSFDDVHQGDAPSGALAPVGLLRRTVGGEYTLRLFDESDSWTMWPGRWGKWVARGGDGPMGPYYKAHYRTLPEEIAGWESPHNSGE